MRSPHSLYLLLTSRLTLPNEQMLRPLLATLDLQELIKLQHALLAARPSLAPFMENRLSGMEHAFLLLPRYRRIVARIAPFSATGSICWDLKRRVIIFRLFGDRCSRSRRRGRNGWRNSWRNSWSRLLCRRSWFRGDGGALSGLISCLLCRLNGCVVHRQVLAGGAGRNCQEFFKGEDAGFAAFPACFLYIISLACPVRSSLAIFTPKV